MSSDCMPICTQPQSLPATVTEKLPVVQVLFLGRCTETHLSGERYHCFSRQGHYHTAGQGRTPLTHGFSHCTHAHFS